ncbi:MAG: N-acetylmuramoyl-L-alanine amidase [Bradyrhizobium sp.]|uniref:N-acetylmuramoyl-L-alanine amidase n=1 Tax=Bradyrhizobium sp. TaxID=376 RepID=UPI001DBEDBE5|nr:N-acetylmuramoyl-L-alanine amidase [Bradyrhizobium sp.]MBV9564225.1 N-acetylmuramoyl-L-alanine amidase [Bradyrhizobium sp.]
MASHANRYVWPGYALLCAAALVCATGAGTLAAETRSPQALASFPVASDARVAGDTKQTRFILDLDKTVPFRAFMLDDPYRVVLDLPQVSFQLPAGAGTNGRGLIKAFRYGMVMPGGSRIVFDLTGPARIANSYGLDSANGQPARLVLDLEQVDNSTFSRSLAPQGPAQPQTAAPGATGTAAPAVSVPQTIVAVPPPTAKPTPPDTRPVVVIDPGHGGVDNGTQSGGDLIEKSLVLDFALALRDRLEKAGKYRVVMTRSDDTFITLADRVAVARSQKAALFVSIHADALPKGEGEAQGATIYTLSDKASDAEAERLAETENRADAIGGLNLTDAPTDVADILIDLAQRETRTFSNRFAHLLMGEFKSTVRLHKHPLKSAGFKVLKNADVPSVLVEIGYVSNKADLDNMASDAWRAKAVESMGKAIDVFLAKRVAKAAAGN